MATGLSVSKLDFVCMTQFIVITDVPTFFTNKYMLCV